jgi:hypothetical protein
VGEEPDRIAPKNHGVPKNGDPSEQDLRELEREIAASRERLSDVVAELDRRRHHLFSLEHHPLRIAAIAAGAVAFASGFTFAVYRRRRRQRSLSRHARKLSKAFGRMAAHPERAASDAKSPLTRIAVVIAPVLVKKIADAVLSRRRRR